MNPSVGITGNARPFLPNPNSLVIHRGSTAPANVLLMHALLSSSYVYPAAPLWPAAPPAANPAGNSPHPPTGNLGVVEIRVGFDLLAKLLPVDEPQVSRVHVGLVNRPISPTRHQPRLVLDRSPKVSDETVQVVNRLSPGRSWTPQEHGSGAKEGLDVVNRIAETLPDQIRHTRFAAEPGKWGFELHRSSISQKFPNTNHAVSGKTVA
jgi:hypothetical protein